MAKNYHSSTMAMVTKKFASTLCVGITLLLYASPVSAQDKPATPIKDTFARAEVITILKEEMGEVAGTPSLSQKLKVQLTTGAEKGSYADVVYGTSFNLDAAHKLNVGDGVILGRSNEAGAPFYIADLDRMNGLIVIAILFLVATFIFGRLRGVTSLLGLMLSMLVLVGFVIPQVVAGRDPLTISIIGAAITALISLYLAHGVSKKTTIALISTLITLCFAGFLATFFVKLSNLSGTGSDDSMYLQQGQFAGLNLQGLLLGGIIIGTLGVLDDITTGQVAIVNELKEANRSLGWKELYRRALRVGREHIASLVNTLALAYVGAAFPLLLLFAAEKDIPIWITFNSEPVAEEVIRTLVGSVALICAVPITTFLAAYFLRHRNHDHKNV